MLIYMYFHCICNRIIWKSYGLFRLISTECVLLLNLSSHPETILDAPLIPTPKMPQYPSLKETSDECIRYDQINIKIYFTGNLLTTIRTAYLVPCRMICGMMCVCTSLNVLVCWWRWRDSWKRQADNLTVWSSWNTLTTLWITSNLLRNTETLSK